MSLEDFLADLGDARMGGSSQTAPAARGACDFRSAALVRLDEFTTAADSPTAFTQAASIAADLHKEISAIADIARSRLASGASELAALFPKNSELVRLLLDLSLGRQSDSWLDRPRQLALSTSLATIDHSVFQQTLEDLRPALAEAVRIEEAQRAVADFLAQSASRVAPTLTDLLQDPEIVARLIMAAGGLERLASIPSANIAHVGKEHAAKRQGAQGILATSQLVTGAKIVDQPKILKTLANKCGLAARVDAFRTSEPADTGVFKAALERRLKTAPLQVRTVKPLPVPTTVMEKTHRAGKRIRKKKEQIRGRVVASRVKFGVQERDEL